jgi:hypothetical protein
MTMTDQAGAPDRRQDELYELLPAVYRERDAALGEPLRALLRIVGGQASLVEADIRQLWADFFVETCEPWVIPYIGDLVGTTPLFDASRIRQPDTAGELFPDLAGPRLIPEVALRARADVAKTIYYRRRKGTLPMLEELARDVTGWGAHAVEFFELLGWTQWVRNHLRLHSPRTPDIRRVEPIDRLDGPFDTIAHTVDVRPISQLEGHHNIKNIGFFLWRLRSMELDRVQARRVGGAGDFRYHVSPLGNPAPLFTRWRREGDEAGLATELHVPGPIRPAAFFEDLARYQALPTPRPGFSDFYGLFEEAPGSGLPQAPDPSLMVFRDGQPVPPEQVRCTNLESWQQPATNVVGVDVKLGRLAFGPGLVPAQRVDVWYHQGFPADLGGGPYERGAWLVRRALAQLVIRVDQSGLTPGSQTTLAGALQQWVTAGRPNTIISIVDSRTYVETAAAPGAPALTIEPRDGHWLVIEAVNGERPLLRLVDGPLVIAGDHPDASVTLSGLLVEGWVHVTGSLGRLRLLHSTLVPGRALTDTGGPAGDEPSLVVEPGTAGAPLNADLRVELAFSVSGGLRIPDHAAGLWALDSIVDGVALTPEAPRPAAIAGSGGPAGPSGPPAWLERVTVLGPSSVKELTMASEVSFSEPVVAERRQAGCVRFSFVPDGSATPQRYRCQPDLEIAVEIEAAEAAAKADGTTLTTAERDAIRAAVREWLLPAFTSTRYGQPAYCQLHLLCPVQIQTGAEDGSEIGAYCHLKQPQRAANLRLRLDEYLPFGLEAGLIYVT